MLREFCAENLVNVREAIGAGAQRVELCGDLSVGGITPSDEVIEQAVNLVHGLGATVMVMVRPRGGDFAYSEPEVVRMENTIRRARDLGADGVVFGCVRDGRLDEGATCRLVQTAKELDRTFHMAFDQIRPELQATALEKLARIGFSRVLTHGGRLELPIETCMPHLHELVDVAARYNIAIMPGGGVTWQNAHEVCTELGVSEVHGTRICKMT